MAVKIRLSRIGKTNRPYWRVVVVDERRKRDGAYLDNLGTYDPVKHELVQFHSEKLQTWVAQGAICTPAVLKLIKRSSQT